MKIVQILSKSTACK